MTNWPFGDLEPGSFDVIASDPPWRFRTWSETNQAKSASKHYGLMMLDDIKRLPVGQLAQDHAILLLWGTGAMMPQQLDVMLAWGFTYKSMLVWRKLTRNGKVQWGTGYWARSMHEVVLIGMKGKPPTLKAFPSLFDGEAREHSRKPESFYKMVDERTVGLKKADLFSRESRPTWKNWGAEKTKFDQPNGMSNDQATEKVR